MNCRGACRQLSWRVRYRIPEGLERLEGLQVNASIFSVEAIEILPVAHVQVTTSNAAVKLQGLDSRTVDLKTSNSAIAVQGKVSDKAVLTSSNGRISSVGLSGADISVKTSNSAIEGEWDVARRLSLLTSNGKIQSTVNLLGDSSSIFDVVASTTNDKIDLRYGAQPVRSTLHSTVSSSNSAVLVSHAPNYEGSFHGQTSNAPADVEGPLTTRHPDRPEVSRVLTIDRVTRFRPAGVDGSVYWLEAEGERQERVRGTSVVGTSNSKCSLAFL